MAPSSADRPLLARRRLGWAGAGVLAFLLARALAFFPQFAEATWGEWVAPGVAWALSRITGIVPVSIAELAIAAFCVRQIHGLAGGILDVARRGRSFGNAAATGALRLAGDFGIVLVLLYGLWGFQYARPDAEARLGWPTADDAVPSDVAALAAEMIEAANAAYRELHGSEDAGVPTALADPKALDASIEKGWRRAAATCGIRGPATARYGPAKRLFASPLLDRLGLSGFFFPFTGEANVNACVPAV